MKRLEDMPLEELWKLFPIELTAHNADWAAWAEDEIGNLRAMLRAFSPTISHIGSTAIPGIAAKPIIDILVETSPDTDSKKIRELLGEQGYICMSYRPRRISFNKGYTPSGYARKVFHIHVVPSGHRDEILFRDYLIAHPETAKEYESLKLSLLPKFRNNRDGYTDAKTPFIEKVMKLAYRAVTNTIDPESQPSAI